MNAEQITQINQDQYRDELDRKIEVYDGVKATLKLCRTMIRALDTTSDTENWSQAQLLSYLDLAQSYAMLAAVDVDLELRGLRK